jgi:hypothetical protein
VGSSAFGLPRRLEDTLDKLEQGDVRVRVRSIETDRALRRISNVGMGTNYVLLMGTFILSATILLVNQFIWPAAISALIAVGLGIVLVRHLLRIDRYERMQ